MNRITRTLAMLATGIGLSVAVAPPALAAGEGCYGFETDPDAYLCVTSVAPENAVPDVRTTAVHVATIPSVCYDGSSCTFETPVYAQLVVVTPDTAPVVTFVYRGETYSVGMGGVEAPVDAWIALATELVGTTAANLLAELESDCRAVAHDVRKALRIHENLKKYC